MGRIKLLLLLLIVCSVSNSTNYFVKNGGSDAGNGLTDGTAWETLAKLEGESLLAGDTIFLNRGDIWYERLQSQWDGADGNPIVFTLYGSGVNPFISASDDTTTPLYDRENCIFIDGESYLEFIGIDMGYSSSSNLATTTLSGVCVGIVSRNCNIRNSGSDGVGCNQNSEHDLYTCNIFNCLDDGISCHQSGKVNLYGFCELYGSSDGVHNIENSYFEIHDSCYIHDNNLTGSSVNLRFTGTCTTIVKYSKIENAAYGILIGDGVEGTVDSCYITGQVTYGIDNGGVTTIDHCEFWDITGTNSISNQSTGILKVRNNYFKNVGGGRYRGSFQCFGNMSDHDSSTSDNNAYLVLVNDTNNLIENCYVNGTSSACISRSANGVRIVNCAFRSDGTITRNISGAGGDGRISYMISNKDEAFVADTIINIEEADFDTIYQSVVTDNANYALPIAGGVADGVGIPPLTTGALLYFNYNDVFTNYVDISANGLFRTAPTPPNPTETTGPYANPIYKNDSYKNGAYKNGVFKN